MFRALLGKRPDEPEGPRERRQHVFIYDPVHGERVRPGASLHVEFLSPIPKKAKASLWFKRGSEKWSVRRPMGDSFKLPLKLPNSALQVQVRVATRDAVWLSQWIGIQIDPKAPAEPATGPRIYCPAPWAQMNIGKANASPCCNLTRKFRNPYRDDHEGYDPWNSRTMQALRAALVRGDSKFCYKNCKALAFTDPDLGLRKFGALGKEANERRSSVEAAKNAFLRGDTRLDSHPMRIKLTVNHFCNHACLFCSRDIRSSWKANDSIFQILQRHLGGTTHIGMTGGEPLVFLDEVSGRLSDLENDLKGTALEITTNASLIEKSIDFLASVDDLRLYVSLNAGTRETYKAVHRKDHFQRVIDGIRLLKERRKGKPLFIRLKMVMMKHNIGDIPAYTMLARELDVDQVKFTPALLYDKADMTREDQIGSGSDEWRQVDRDLEYARIELMKAGIRCSIKAPGWKREDAERDPLSMDEELD